MLGYKPTKKEKERFMNNKQLFLIAMTIVITACLILITSLIAGVTHAVVLQDHTKDILGDITNSLIVIVSLIIGQNLNNERNK